MGYFTAISCRRCLAWGMSFRNSDVIRVLSLGICERSIVISERCLEEQNRSKLVDVLKNYREEEKIEIREVTGRRLVVGNQ